MNPPESPAPEAGTRQEATGRGGWWFLGIMIVVYLVLAGLRPELAQRAWQAFLHLGRVIAPVLVLVYALMLLSNLLVRGEWVRRTLGHSSGVRGYLVATVAGVLSTGPIYVWYPFLADLRDKGAKDALLAVFLYNRAIKLPWLPVMVAWFGVRYTVLLTVATVLAGIAEGLAMEGRGRRQRAEPGR